MQEAFDQIAAALQNSHQRLVAALDAIGDDVGTQSYASEWSVAQVASHLGSGAEIFRLMLDAGLTGDDAPGVEAFHPIWDKWNSMAPAEQAKEAVAADAAFLDRLAGLTDDQVEAWSLEFFHERRDLTGLASMRLGEHAVHTWDIVVSTDPGAGVATDAAALILDSIGPLVSRAAKPSRSLDVAITTTEPERSLVLAMTPEGASIEVEPSDPPAASLQIPAEGLVRLVYGRLDPDHTPSGVNASGVDLETLREVFPGF